MQHPVPKDRSGVIDVSLIIDESKYPLVVARWTEVLTDDELRRMLTTMDAWLARQQPFGLLIDSRGGWPFSSAQRGWVIEHMQANRSKTERWLVQALVIENPLVRALYYAVSWAVPMPFPSKVFADEGPAIEWLEMQLRAKNRERRESA